MPFQKSPPVATSFAADDRQRQAIEHFTGPILVVAGAGTGKTTVLTRRIAELIREHGIRPDEILALTYTLNAAREMTERARAELRNSGHSAAASGVRCITFHAYCNELLIRNNAKFDVLDDCDLWIFLRRRLRELNLSHFMTASDVGKSLSDLRDFMNRCQDELVGPAAYADYVGRLERGELPVPAMKTPSSRGTSSRKKARKKKDEDLTPEEIIGRCREISHVYSTVDRLLREHNLGTFGHQITRAHALLETNPTLRAVEQSKARFILVDEFQDANSAQIEILGMLAGPERNIFAVGDPDQAIYHFRGASSAAFSLFAKRFPDTKLVVLEKNRRSTTPILQSAFGLIAANPEVYGTMHIPDVPTSRTPLVSAREENALQQGIGPRSALVDIALMSGKENEGVDLIDVIQQTQRRARCDWSDFAVLYRSHSHCEPIALELTDARIPFTVENTDVTETPQARDLFACIGAIISDTDSASLFRVAALPQFGIRVEAIRASIRCIPRDERSAGLVVTLPNIEGGPAVLQVLQQSRDEIGAESAKTCEALDIITRRFALDRESQPLQAVLNFAAEWQAKRTPVTLTGELSEFLEYLDYFRQAGGKICLPPEPGAVRLMTVHSAKGLEFKHVFILRANSNSFPASYKQPLIKFPLELRREPLLVPGDEEVLHREEERRLFYVAMTRARDTLTIYAKRSTSKSNLFPAGFLRDLLAVRHLQPWLRQRQAKAFQAEIFAAAASAVPGSRVGEWLSLPPAEDLHKRLSASSIQNYKTCPLKFKLEREWRLPTEAPAALQYGGAMHRVLKAYYDSVRYERTFSEDELLDHFRSELEVAAIQDRYQHEVYEKQGIDQLRTFLLAASHQPPPKVLHTEEPFIVEIGGTTVAGRVDRIDQLPNGQVAITDYKTGKPQSQEDADESLQLSIYALAVRAKWGYEVGDLVLHSLTGNEKIISDRDGSELLNAELRVKEVAALIAEGNFEPKPGFYCRFCAYQNICPATEKRISPSPATSKPKSKRTANRG